MEGKELINEFADLINRSYKHCNEYRKTHVNCKECAFHWSFSIRSHGCLLVELEHMDSIENLDSVMRYHKMDVTKISNLRFEEDDLW